MLGLKLKRIVLGIQYDGAPWHGWQTQLSRNTVQDRLESALRQFALEEIKTSCAGRTDTGVHAIEQVVHFDTFVHRDMFAWVRGTNAFLPPSISVRWAHEVPHGEPGEDVTSEFHARFSAIARTYHYILYNHPVRSALLAGRAGWAFRPLDVVSMRIAAQCLIGEHDFSAFRAAACQAKSPLKTMHSIDIQREGDMICFSLHANAFLHHMVRNIVGTLVYIGSGIHAVSWMQELLQSKDRTFAAPTFMPDGLYLAKIDYDAKWALPQAPLAKPWMFRSEL